VDISVFVMNECVNKKKRTIPVSKIYKITTLKLVQLMLSRKFKTAMILTHNKCVCVQMCTYACGFEV